MKTVITPDSTQRIVLTRAMSKAAGIRSGEKLEVTVTPGAANNGLLSVRVGQTVFEAALNARRRRSRPDDHDHRGSGPQRS